jgi:predicted nucleotidyltransferase/DNA-binding XRE family transcriptional regulator
MTDVARLLLDARRQAGLSQAELARRAGISQPVVSAYERGRREPSLATARRLVEATGHELRLEVVGPVGPGPRPLPDTPMGRRLARCRSQIVAAAERGGARNVRVFGSVARGVDTPTSDVDLLVDLDADVGMVRLVALEQELGRLLRREVDVVPARNLKPGVADTALVEAIPL